MPEIWGILIILSEKGIIARVMESDVLSDLNEKFISPPGGTQQPNPQASRGETVILSSLKLLVTLTVKSDTLNLLNHKSRHSTIKHFTSIPENLKSNAKCQKSNDLLVF
jgi:hypothetical protein